MNRGSLLPNAPIGKRTHASMRPRFMNRGSDGRRNRAEHPRAASMRPRFMNRGSSFDDDEVAPGMSGFNEAPIHESGKSIRLR